MLAPKTFSGGIHPPAMKTTSDKAVVKLPLPDKVVLHLSQHIGAPAKSTLQINDKVTYGQVIAEAGGFVSAPIHATISGRIIAFGNFKHPLGQSTPAIVIERDVEAQEPVYTDKPVNGLTLPPAEILKRIKDAGIVGLGGAAFPAHVKLSPPAGVVIDTVILNGAECEPYLTADHRTMLEQSEKVVDGLRLVMKVLNAKRGFIAIEDNKPDAIEALDDIVHDLFAIDVQPLVTKYPQGGEKQLIKAVTGREVPNGKLPSDVGVVVMNVTSAAAVSDAVNYCMPLTEKTVTLAGDCVKNPGNYRVRIGTTISDFIQMTGGLKENIPLKKVILGGPMMGFALYDLNTPIIKGTSGILCWSQELAQPKPRTGCLRCGKCVEACPMGLEPLVLDALINAKKYEEAEKEGILNCVNCGSCAYTCPGGNPLVQNFIVGKNKIIADKKKKAALAKEEKK
jgi:electron transport complex protein RnfC